jgi:hypothetical protein
LIGVGFLSFKLTTMSNKLHSYYKGVILSVAFFVPFSIVSQSFEMTYPTTYDRTSREVLPTADGGYIIAGVTNNSSINDCDAYIVKTNGAGVFQWDKVFGGAKPDYPYSMIETTDGNYMITGFTQSFGGGDMDIYLLKIDPSGNKIFEKTLGSFGNDEGREIIKSADGNYVIVGTSSSYSGSRDVVLFKIDNSGTEIWRKTYGSSAAEYGNGVALCPDGGFIITGQTFSGGPDGQATLIKTDANGTESWTKSFGNSLTDEGIAVVANTDGSFVFAVRDSTASNDIDVHIIKTDAGGVKVWEKTYGSTEKDTPKRLRATNDGGYIVGAISRSFGWINPDMWLLKLDAAGDLSWVKNFGGVDHEHCHDIKQTPDGGYLAAGHARSWTPGQKVYFIKMGSNGEVGLSEFANIQRFMIYPNPAVDDVTVELPLELNPTSVRVSNMLGQVIFSEDLQRTGNNLKSIDLKNNQSGVYMVTLQTNSGPVSQKIILK